MKFCEACWRAYLEAFIIARGVEAIEDEADTNDLLAMAIAVDGTSGADSTRSSLMTRVQFDEHMAKFGGEEDADEDGEPAHKEASPC